MGASAATFTYDLFDHPGASKAGTYDYGLRLDEQGKRFFSFNAGSATLTYDDVLGKVRIAGTMVESLGNGMFGAVWNVKYTINNVTDLGNGLFEDFSGTGVGTISDGVTSFALGAQALGGVPPNGGQYFQLLADADRLDDSFPDNTIVGRGWVNSQDPNCCNDFLFIAEEGGGGRGVVPLPAAAWMLLSGVAGLGVVARR
eukprot:CAMPEP_0198244138 /NCGR_PEP_ID=MMETSP1446-20131203/33202_1 /TAXON_ID=1461542 ORGANISM="Unidentified sp, Strain CCMP2111" /NCGR_SAMPLE_ID=MMETSP1446 /ASSEMBLY_ACC=CAM_ASM_001112 /LENGTH=199 /DNA_ID=CAMNT_0043928117 /DNA_START=35 /DNA_END=631 /DNA_ORIENTATION=+